MELKTLTTYELFLFDFDGLLVNTEELHYQAYLEMLDNHGIDLNLSFDEFAALAHTSATALKDFLEPMLPHIKWKEIYEEKQVNLSKLLSSGQLTLMPGADEMLMFVTANDLPLAVATNSRLEHVQLVIESLPALKAIKHWITREDYLNPKPAPDAYLTAIEKTLPGATQVIGFEDSMRGIHSLIAANVDPVLICSLDHPQMAQKPDVPHFTSFYTFLEKMSQPK